MLRTTKKGFYGSDKHAKFYVASVVFAFQHLHERHVIFRDLKPENLLLTETGHLKVTDMGLAKFVIGTTYTSCGTPEYFAPELITHAGHTNAVDWWTLGILSFELMSGHSPFAAPNAEKIYEKVKAGIHAIKLPHSINGAVADFICSLLQPEPSQRLPMRAGGVDNLKSHRWFKSFDWDDAFNLRMPVPYTPTLRNKCDLANFTGKTIDKSRQLDYVDDGTGWDSGFATC
jgi:protein kinase X